MTPIEAPSKPPRSAPLREKLVWARTCPKTNGGEKISHERFAPMIGTSRRHLMRIERGQHRPGSELVRRIAEATGHELDYFADDDDEEADRAVGRFGRDMELALRRGVQREVRRALAEENAETAASLGRATTVSDNQGG